jgi:hypothetical protein
VEAERERGEGKQELDGAAGAAGGKKKGKQTLGKEIRKNRGEGGMDFPKDLCVNTENYKGLSVKQNFPLT